MMQEEDANYEEQDADIKAVREAEESDVQSPRNLEREEDSDIFDWEEKQVVVSRDREESGEATKLIGEQPRAVSAPGIEAKFHAFSADDDDDDPGSYQIVKKSIYKPHRKSFLSRFAPVGSTKQKYAPSDISGIVIGEEAETTNSSPTTCEGKVDLTLEEEEEEDGIQVAIDRAARTPRGARGANELRRLNAEDAALGGPSEVVIHSGDSDLGFATLNPIINSSAPNHGAFVAPAMTKSSSVPVAKAKPILLEIPVAELATPGRDRLLLIINALGATGLPKAEKFGTQSCLLEMRLFDGTAARDPSNTASWSSYLMRTELHKKGGSEAQWNQQFTTSLRSKELQVLHVEVKTSSKILVGETNVPLHKVGDLFYDQHYPLCRNEENDETGNDSVLLSAGQVHLQLKIVDTMTVPLPSAVIPPLQLPLFTSSETTSFRIKSPISSRQIPAVLLNGGLFFKIPYHTHNVVGYTNGPRRQWVAVRRATDPPHLQMTWGDPTLSGSAERKGLRSLDLALVTEVREGHTTGAFVAQTESNVVKEKAKCFSLITRARTLDLVASSKEEARIWVDNLRELLFATEKSADDSLLSARTIESYKLSALSPRDQEGIAGAKPVPAVEPTKRMIAAWRNRIFNLARHDRLDDILECLEDGCPIDLLESGSGDTLLMLACRLGNAELVELCLSRRAKNDPHPEFGETALQVAVNSSHAHCVGLLLSTAAKSDMDSEIVNHIDPNNDAPLHVAARHGDLACLQLLLHHGADICVVEEFGRTPLHCAVANGNLDCVAYLLDVGGDSVLNSGDHDGDTALHYAALSGNEEIVKLLLESAANVFATNVQNETAYDIAVREQQQRCAELISKYFLTNEKEDVSTRNEPASALLGKLRQEKAGVVFRDNGIVAEEEFVKQIPSASFVHAEVWKPPQSSQVLEYRDDYETYPVKHRSSSYVASGSTTSRMPLSPSEQIRDALTRKHRANSLSPSSSASPWSGASYYSARELSSYSHSSPCTERLVATERLDREHIRSLTQYTSRENDPRYLQKPPQDYYEDTSSNGYFRYGMQTQVPQEYGQPLQAFWAGTRQTNNSMMNSRVEVSPQTACGQYNQMSTNSYPQQSLRSLAESQWEKLYTEDGYPYYVNRSTGVSQWEKPPTEVPMNESHNAQNPQVDTRADSLSPDAIIRLRLAEVRKQNSQTTLLSPASSLATSCSTPRINCQPSVTLKSPGDIGSVSQTPNELVAETRPAENVSSEATFAQEQQPRVSSEPSKYEARTGLKLSVDIKAPPAEDVSRPTLVPSPRSKSPLNKFLEGAEDDATSGSFEKSRASSPRGRSKNIQLIELKRANNLALALASFKIHDHYEQIVSDIVTMDERMVNPALLGCLQRFFPTAKEKQVLQSFNGPISTLGKAERFFYLLFQVPGMQERIDMFIYKMEFTRTHSNLLSRILIVKRACRDLVENFSFIQALEHFFKKHNPTSFSTFQEHKAAFISGHLSDADEKLRSFHGDLEKAMGVELVELQLQLNRLVAGIRPVQSFVNRSPTSTSGRSEDRDGKARDILHRFLAESRAPLNVIETEYEVMELWGDKLLAVFGESKATCQISAILQTVVELL